MDNLSTSKRADISIMRIAATVAVIFLHTCNTISNNASSYFLTDIQMFFLTSGNYLMNWAVPMFLMVTGVLLLKEDKVLTYPICIMKYCKRILLALVIFGIPFSILEIIMDTKQLNISLIPKSILNVLIGKSWSHLWYLYALIGLYLLLPVLKAFVNKCSRKDMRYLLGILLVFNFAIPILNNVFEITVAFGIPIASFEVFYILLGKYLYDEVPKILQKKMAYIFVCVCVILIILVNHFTIPHSNLFLGYNSPLIAFTATVIFVLLKGVSVKNTNLIWKIDRLCFGVYLIHPVFINFIYKFFKITPLNWSKIYPLTFILFWMVFVVCSFTASWCINLIPPLRKYVL